MSVAAAFAIAEYVTLPSTANAANASTPPVVSQPVPGYTSPNCHDFTMPVTVEGQQRQAVGQMCQQPDGSWRVTQNTPGLPPQVYTLPPQAIYVTPYPYTIGQIPGASGPPSSPEDSSSPAIVSTISGMNASSTAGFMELGSMEAFMVAANGGGHR